MCTITHTSDLSKVVVINVKESMATLCECIMLAFASAVPVLHMVYSICQSAKVGRAAALRASIY
jgi:hypothetical protein